MRIKLLNTALCLLFTAAGLHAQETDYGAGAANVRFIPSQGLLGGRTDFDCFRLKNHPAASGVPLGGIGAGNVQFAPDGRFVRIGMNNIHLPIRKSTGSFFTLWHRSGGTADARRLVRDTLVQYGMEGVSTTYYTGLFPRAELDPGEVFPGAKVRIRACSPLIAHNVKDSSLPLAFFDVELESAEGGETAVAFSWEDFIGRGIREPESIEGMDGQLFGQGRNKLCNGEEWPERPLEQTFARTWECGAMAGVRQFAAGPLQPKRANFQNYVDEVAVLAQTDSTTRLSALTAYDLAAGGVPPQRRIRSNGRRRRTALDAGREAVRKRRGPENHTAAGRKENVPLHAGVVLPRTQSGPPQRSARILLGRRQRLRPLFPQFLFGTVIFGALRGLRTRETLRANRRMAAARVGKHAARLV